MTKRKPLHPQYRGIQAARGWALDREPTGPPCHVLRKLPRGTGPRVAEGAEERTASPHALRVSPTAPGIETHLVTGRALLARGPGEA